MTPRIDPFLALEPFALLKLRQAAAGHDLPSLALPRHAGLVRALTALLRMPAPLTTDAASERARLLAEAPDLAPHVALLECCAERLVDVLAGRALASDVMFPGGDMTLVEPIYRGNRWTDHFNRLTAIAVARAVAVRHAQSPGTPVRVLEVGAGTGGTSATVLTALDPYAAHVVYDYTDVSPGFVQHGLRTHAAHRSFVRGRLLDLEKPPAEQGFDLSAYDVVLGTNVLHATGWIARSLDHVHQVLRPGGLLLLNEITRAGAFATMTFGLLDGWWAFRDADMRLPDAPLLSPEGWRDALRSAGFGAPAVYGWTEPAETSFQCLFVAARQAAAPATTNVTTSVQPVLPEARAAAPPLPSSPSQDLRPMLAERLAGLLGLEPHELSLARPFAEFGVDSIVAPQFVSLLNRELGSALVPTDVFNHASIDALAAHLGTMTLAAVPGAVVTVPDPVPQTAPAVPAIAVAVNAVSQQPSPVVAADAGPANDDIAVIGLACRFPGARDADAFWRNLLAGHCAITEVPPDRWDGRRDGTTRWGGFLDEYDCFDPEFFNLSWREAEAMSPQQRVFLEQSWHALEHAGYGRRALAGLRCGVFVGAAPDGYGVTRNDSLSALGGSLAILSARISYLLDLKGPSLPVDTACSSSLVAVHLACRSILAGDCDMALAGGVSILMTNPRLHSFLDDAGMLSPTGQCHTFDAAADGFVPGEGCGIVVLKRLDRALADGDTVMAVIRASGVNQDGRTSGITAPSGKAQTALETTVYRSAGIDPAAISLVEAHGTGTQLGDPIEVKALEAAFRPATDRVGYCALGSVKTNIGHTLTAAGVAGLIKVVLALRHGMIPASLHYATDNPEISFAGSPFFVPRQTMPWSASPRLAAVSSFGFSGTNAHVVVGEAPPRPAAAPTPGPRLILLSGRTAEALETSHAALTAWLADNMPDLADLAHTLSQGRGHHEHRLAILVDSIDDLRAGQGRVWRSLPLTLPARDGQDAEMAALLGAAEPDLARIADCYVRGGDGDWSRLSAPNARRIPLPLTPFARLRFATRDLAPTDAPSPVAPRLHPLLRDNASTLDGVAYRLDLDATAPWLRDHRFGGTAVLPAVAYLELARAAATLAGAQDVAAIEDLHLDHPLTAGTEARIALRSVEGGAAFNVLGAGNDAHAGGRVRFGEPGASAAKINMVAIGARLTAGFTQDQVYARFRSLGFAYGPAFQVIKALRASPTEVLADLAPALPSEAGMVLDPALLDGAVQAAIGLMLAGGEALTSVVPVSVGGATIHGPVRGPCRAYVQAMGGDTDTRRLAVAVIDPDGRALVTLRDLMVRVSAVRPEAAACHAFAPTWDVVAAEPGERPAAVLLFDRDETIWRALGGASVLVRPGSAFCRLDRLSFAIDPARAEDHSRLLETLRSEGLLPATAWHLWSRPEPVGAMRRSDQATVATALREGPRAVMLLAGAFARLSPVDPVEILYGHAEADPEAPLPALVGGFGAAMLRENPLLRIRPVGLPGVDADRTIANLSVATAQPQAAEHWDAHGARLVRRFTPVDLPRPASLRPRGVFLLTGAKGGIGRHIARHLARHCQARLLLVGRTAPDAAVDELIAAIRATGGDAAYHMADVADPAQAMDAAAAARARFGALHGVIHAAGVTRDRFLLHATEADLDAVLAPKVAGTLALDRATASDDLDLFVCFSSLAGSLGNAGQAGYSAANRFLDAFMAMRTGPGRSLSIGWPYWAEGGLQVDAAEQARRTAATGIRSLETEQGLALFDALAGSARGAVLLLPGDAAAMSAMMDPSATPTNQGRAATETDAANDDA
ncbi:MAG: SDR family NAD(P)-dependent oxidoreductase, partial [Acetobacteraceae bacterium]